VDWPETADKILDQETKKNQDIATSKPGPFWPSDTEPTWRSGADKILGDQDTKKTKDIEFNWAFTTANWSDAADKILDDQEAKKPQT
jgi:hypothetical protein